MNKLDIALQKISSEITEVELDKYLDEILTEDYQLNISPEKEAMFLKRTVNLQKAQNTFGNMLVMAMTLNGLSLKSIYEATSLANDLLEKLMDDSVMITKVPVVLLKRLLDKLDISLKDAKDSILKTVEILRIEQQEIKNTLSFRAIYARKSNIGFESETNNQFVSEYFESDEAISMYFERLEELINE